jgi:hypothetical protein
MVTWKRDICAGLASRATLFGIFVIGAAYLGLAAPGMAGPNGAVTWNRQAFGQQQIDPCGNPFNWPDDNDWDQQEVDSTACNQSYVAQPSNWTTPTYPNGSSLDVILGAPAPTSLDIGVTLHSLTVQSGAGDINMTSGSAFDVQLYDFQTDGSFTTSLNHGHGGATPIDYLLFNPNTRQTAIWYLNNNVYVSAAYGPTVVTGYTLTGSADCNLDGKPDYVLFNASTRHTVIWYLNNNVYLSGAYGPTLPAGWSLVKP